jgi:serine/threonine protein kinase
MIHQHSPTDKTEPLHGLSLINEHNQVTRIYLQFRPLSELWISRLASCLNQIGFHDDYRVLERIGRGSTSTVYKVQRLSDGEIKAAKVFLKGFLESKP